MKLRLKQIESVVVWTQNNNNIFDAFNSVYELNKGEAPLYKNVLTYSKTEFYSENANHKLSASCYYQLEFALSIYKALHPEFTKTLDELLEECEENGSLQPIEFVQLFWAQVATFMYHKFASKWDRIWYSLTKDYNPLSNYDMEEKESYNTDKKKEVNTDTTTKMKTDQTTTDTGYVNGFNSSNAVPKDKKEVRTEALPNDNYTNVTGDAESNYEREYGDAEDNYRHLEKSGNIGVRSNQELLEQELEVRKNNFLDIVFSDIQSTIFNRVY